MMHSGSLFSVCELLELGVARCEPLPRQEGRLVLLRGRHELAVERFATLATLLLTDVSQVAVAGSAQTEEEQKEVALATVVERVRPVPVGEGARVLVGQRGHISYFQVAIGTREG